MKYKYAFSSQVEIFPVEYLHPFFVLKVERTHCQSHVKERNQYHTTLSHEHSNFLTFKMDVYLLPQTGILIKPSIQMMISTSDGIKDVVYLS